MNWTEQRIRAIITDLTMENPMACRSLLEIAEIQFTEQVPTMAVSLSDRPVLKINMTFCHKHLKSENDVKCVLLHEFLHVLLMHTSIYKDCDTLLNVALDAIINAIICRTAGPDYAGFFERFYPPTVPAILLRPVANWFDPNVKGISDTWRRIHNLIYTKGYCADDLHELLIELKQNDQNGDWNNLVFLGNHEPEDISESNKKVLNDIMEKMTGVDIWKHYHQPGHGGHNKQAEHNVRNFRMQRWRKSATELIRKCLTPQKQAPIKCAVSTVTMPVLSSGDRRAFLRFRSGGIIPQAVHELLTPIRQEQATVYLDVSGSMDRELETIATLLHQLREWIRLPLLAFSDEVCEARFQNGKLLFNTSGGTTIDCVFDHIRAKQISTALIITDGYLGSMSGKTIAGIQKEKIHFLLTSIHSTTNITDAGFPYRALPPLDWTTD